MAQIDVSKYKALIEQSHDGIVLTDAQGIIDIWNKGMVTITGIQQSDAIGMPLHKVQCRLIPEEQKTPELLEQIRNGLKFILESKIEWSGESREQVIVCSDGTRKVVQDSSFTVKTDTVMNFGTILRDITERKRIEEALQKAQIEEALQKAQKLESLGLLAGGIAHDFNNLMGGIFGYIDLANRESDKRRSSEYLSMAMSTIDRVRALTGQLLTFAKGGAPIPKIDHLSPFVEETVKFALSGANVSCHFDVPKDLWDSNFDKNQIGQVIDNIIINAQQAMPVGGTIGVSARNLSLAEKEHPILKKGDYVKISVKDSGVGIPKEHISSIFDPFFTTKSKGHGLGLATSYSIINRHGGSIDVESEPGKGSTFHVYLPASTDSAVSSADKTVSMHKGAGTFLVMDDEEVIRETICRILSSFGYTVVCKECGKDAVEFFAAETKANRKIAGMIFDLTIPGGMGGKDAVTEIRKLNTDIPVFVSSGYAEDPVLTKPSDYGFTASIRKPFMISELSETLNKYMQSKK